MNEPAAAPEAQPNGAPAPDATPAPEVPAAPPEPSIADVRREHGLQTARLEAALRKAERAGLDSKQRLGALEEAQKQLDTWKGDKWEAAKALGITFEEMSQRILDGKENPTPAELDKAREREELQSVKKQLDEERSIREERDTAAGFESDVLEVAKMLPDDSLLKALGHERLLTQVLYEEHRRTGEVPDVQELIAAHEKQTISNLTDALKSEAGRAVVAADSELKSALLAAFNPEGVGDESGSTGDKQSTETEPQAKFGQPNHRVITNALGAEVDGRGVEKIDESKVTDDDRRARAIEVMRQLRKAQG